MNHRHDPRRVLTLLGIGSAAVLFAACSSSPATSPTTTSSTTPTSTTGSSSTSTTTPVPCTTAGLTLSVSTGGASAGLTYDIFSLTNSGSSTCQLEGYPSVLFYGTGTSSTAPGPKLNLAVQDGGDAPVPVNIEAGKAAEFLLFFSDVPVGGAGCTTVGSVSVALTGNSASVSAPASFSPCGPSVKVYAFGASGSENP